MKSRIEKQTVISLPPDFCHLHMDLLRRHMKHDSTRILIDASELASIDSEKLGLLVITFPPSSDELPISIVNSRREIKGILRAAMMDGYFIVE